MPVPVTENSMVLAWQLGNMYLVLGFVAVALFTSTTEVKVIRRYLVALALGDVGHITSTCYALGMERLMKPAELNSMAYANIVMTVRISALPYFVCLALTDFLDFSVLGASCLLQRRLRP